MCWSVERAPYDSDEGLPEISFRDFPVGDSEQCFPVVADDGVGGVDD